MASEWIYQVMDKQVGPISSAELRSLAQQGTVKLDTPVRKAPDGAWVPAGRVDGLFALPNGSPQPATAPRTASPPPRAPLSEKPSGLGAATKITLVVAGGLCILVLGFLVWFIAGRDTWELNNASRVFAKLDEAARLQQSDPLTAYKTYDELLKEAKQHKITDERFAQQLADAEKSRTALYPRVQEKIQAEQAEKQRLAQEEARRAAEEKQRAAEEEERGQAAEKKKREEEERIKEAIAAYRNIPQSARNALNAVKKLEARTEVGVNYTDYSKSVGDAWGDVKIFIESREGKPLTEFSHLLANAMADYKLALDIWADRVRWEHLRRVELEVLQQHCWTRAGMWIKLAESLLDAEQLGNTLRDVAAALKNAEDFQAEQEKIRQKIHNEIMPGS